MDNEIYFINFPFDIENNKIDKIILDNTVLSSIEDPIILYTRLGDTLDLKNLYNHPKLYKVKKIQFFLFEWIHYYMDDTLNFNRGGYSETLFNSNSHKKLRSEILDKLTEFSYKTGIEITVNTCEYNISKYFSNIYPLLELRCLGFYNQVEAFGYNFACDIPFKKSINYKFWCATNRFAIHRHIVSCYVSQKSVKLGWPFLVNNLSKGKNFLQNLPWDKILQGNDILNKKDFFIDQKVQKTTVHNYFESPYPEYKIQNNPSEGEKFLNTFRDCFLSLCCESMFFQPTASISEKTFNAVFTFTPFVIVGPPLSLEYLQKLGFKTFDRWWDESYDQETDHEKRLIKIFEIIDYIDSLSFKELQKILSNMKTTLEYNKNHLLKCNKDNIILP